AVRALAARRAGAARRGQPARKRGVQRGSSCASLRRLRGGWWMYWPSEFLLDARLVGTVDGHAVCLVHGREETVKLGDACRRGEGRVALQRADEHVRHAVLLKKLLRAAGALRVVNLADVLLARARELVVAIAAPLALVVGPAEQRRQAGGAGDAPIIRVRSANRLQHDSVGLGVGPQPLDGGIIAGALAPDVVDAVERWRRARLHRLA